mgnify:CR=1 FL=1
MKTINVETAATKDLVAFYNANAAHFGKKVVTKFADRATAELRVRQMVADLEAEETVKNKTAAVKTDERKGADRRHEPAKIVVPQAEKKSYDYAVDGCPTCKATEDQTAAGLDGTKAGDERNFCHHCGTEYWRDTGKIYKAPAVSTTRSKGISESWNNPEVAAKRAQRHNVKVVLDGKEVGIYRSTLDAFKKLNLPQSSHIKFRMALKAEGKKEYKSGDKTYKFSLVEQKELPLK